MKLEHRELSELRDLLDTRQISSVELTNYFLNRITELDTRYNSFITVTPEVALSQAKAADECMSSDGTNPDLCGIPYAAKDLFVTKGIRSTAASLMLDTYKPPYNATVIEKLNASKSVLLGKTNLDQFAHGSSTETSAYGPSKNPWDTTRIPGGSSGGSTAAQAAGLCPWALATETGGSIRQPASLCGVSGWKPTYGRVSRYGCIAMASSLDSMGAVANSVQDLVMIANTLSGVDPKDGTTGDKPANFTRTVTGVKGLRIGVPKEYFPAGVEDGVKSRIMEAVAELEKQGAVISEVSLPHTKYGSLVYAIICPAEVASNLSRYDGIRYGHATANGGSLLDGYMKTRAEGFGNEAKRRILTGTYVLSAGYYDAYYKRAQKVRRLLMNEFNKIFTEVDVLVAPSSPNVAVPLGKAADNPLFGYIADQLNIPSSLAGLPAVSLPCGFSKPHDGANVDLPVGLQVVGPQWADQLVFNVGMTYQSITDWHKKFPNS